VVTGGTDINLHATAKHQPGDGKPDDQRDEAEAQLLAAALQLAFLSSASAEACKCST